LILKIRVAQHDKETSVEKDTEKDSICDVFHLNRLCADSDFVDDDNDSHSDSNVDSNNSVR
jgi:hypothetical protein